MKRAIIIGASSGIGYQLAIDLVADGYMVAVTGRRLNLLEQLAEQFPGKILPMLMDVKALETIQSKLDELNQQLGQISLLVIAAGVGDLNPELDFEIEKEMIDTNILGFTSIADWAFRQFSKQQYGVLAAITSIAGIRGNRQSPAYSATKAYQVNYLEGLRQKAFKAGNTIRIIDIRPGFINTKMAKGEQIFWVTSVEKACRQMLAGIRREQSVIYISKRWRLVGGLLKFIPRFIHKRL